MENKTKPIKRIRLFNIVIFMLIIIGIGWIASKFIHFGRVEYTNNAQVHQHITPLHSRVQGFIREIRFEEFQRIHKGDTLVVLDDAEFRLRVAQAEADLQNALASRNVAGATTNTAQNNISVSDASIEEVKILLHNARTELTRYENLLAQDAVTRQQYDAVKTTYEATLAKYNTLTRQRQSTSLISNEQVQRFEQQELHVKLAEAALELARLNLSYTVIVATADGVMGRKAIQEGQLIQPGQAVATLVKSRKKWIIANYKETQTTRIAEGQTVEITVDAVPGVKFKGIVRSVSEATGSAYSLIPTNNAAGNFVKVEQRIPVRIEFTDNNRQEDIARLRGGMNAECKVKY
jgi:membrane fusion protein (multidrug efflux system)